MVYWDMIPADPHPQENQRLVALVQQRLLDTPNEAAFDDLVQLASIITGCPISLVSLVDHDRQWFKARYGLEATETPRSLAFCAHAILNAKELFEVEDAALDARFADNPLVTHPPDIRFYAGVPIVVSNGMPIGTLCVIDRVPRTLTDIQRDALSRLGRQVERQMQLRLLAHESQQSAERATNAQVALQASEARFRAMSEASPLGVFVTDATGAATYLNPQWLHIAGMTVDKALGAGWISAIHPDDRERVSAAWYAAARERRPFLSEHRFSREDGSVVWTRVRAAEMCAADLAGNSTVRDVIGYVGTVEDISDSKRIEVELTRARDEALIGVRLKSDFLATMSHEIRTPMNGVIGMTGLLLDTVLGDQQREYVEIIRNCADSLMVLINDILDFSKIEAGALALETTSFDPLQIVEEAASLLGERAQAKGLDLVVRLDPGLPTALEGDPGRLRQVLVNLLGNAIKFTESGTIELVVGLSGGQLVMRIVDSGIGMEPATMAKLFHPFSQADDSTSRRFGGTGLGLAICKRLVELMGGRIGARSQLGVGSTFSVELPAPTLIGDNRAGVALGGAAIAVSPALRPAIEPWIIAWGGRVVAVGQTAAASLIDVRDVKRNPQRDRTLVLVTNLTNRLGDQQVSDAGIAACITQPLRISAVSLALARALGQVPAAPLAAVQHDRDWPQFSGRVLVADDNPVNVKVAVALLGKLGLRADATANGLEALSAMERLPYDLVLMDCQMPELDGFGASAELRRRESARGLKRVPVVALTANAMPGDRDICLASGMDEYLSKPIRIDELVEIVRRFLGQKASAPAAQGPGISHPHTATHSPVLPDFDATAIDQLLEDLGDPTGAILVDLESSFHVQAIRQVAEVGLLMAARDLAGVATKAHGLKGPSLTLGLTAFAGAAADLEKAAKAGDHARCEKHAADLPELYVRASTALARRIHG